MEKIQFGTITLTIITLKLRRCDYEVNVEKVGAKKIDFTVRRNNNHSKTVITLDRFTLGNYEGIKVVNAIERLINQ